MFGALTRPVLSLLGIALATSGLAVAVAPPRLAGATPAPVAAADVGPAAGAGAFGSLAPARLLDTRNGTGAPRATLASKHTLTLTVLGRGGVPATGVSAVALNLAETGATHPGYITAWPNATTQPNASSLNFPVTRTIANHVVVPIGTDGKIALYNGSPGPVNLIADIAGYYLAGTPTDPGTFGSLAPARLLDTRNGTGAPRATLASKHTLTLTVLGRGGVPATGVSAVALNLAETGATHPGYITAWPNATTQPNASSLNFPVTRTIANHVVVPIGTDGKIALYNGSPGPVNLIADIAGYYLPIPPVQITTDGLDDAVAGLAYKAQLSAGAGVEPYSWVTSGLPDGLSVNSRGAISGTPAEIGTYSIDATVTDAAHNTDEVTVQLAVPTTVPPDCVEMSCAHLAPDGHTVQVAASDVVAVHRDPDSGVVTSLQLAGAAAPTAGDILVAGAVPDAPSGLIELADDVTTETNGTVTVTVSPASPADAYNEGTVQSIGDPVVAAQPASSSAAVRTPTQAARAAKIAATRTGTAPQQGERPSHGSPKTPTTQQVGPAAGLSCSGGVSSSLHGLDVQPALTPTIAALWKHPFFGGGGIYIGTGGLSLFQFDLDGSITLNFGVEVSGQATCKLSLPGVHTAIPAGALGAVLLDLDPSITFTVSGKVDLRESVTLRCGAEYRWNNGSTSRVSYCTSSYQPLQLSADSGLDATLTAKLDASVTLDDVIGITGSLSASLHAGYHPSSVPAGEIDASADYELGACLACFWKGSPAQVQLASGEFFHKTLATFATVPIVSNAPVIVTTHLPDASVGSPYSTQLTTADHRSGTWAISSGSLPDGLTLNNFTISGKPTTPGPRVFQLRFTDTHGQSTTAYASIQVIPQATGGSGAIQDLDYCRTTSFTRNDDDSTDAIALPFEVNFYGGQYSSVYVSNNGYVTFGGSQSTYTPYSLIDSTRLPLIAPFFADVDTRPAGSSLVTFGSSPDGQSFCVDWVDVGYYNDHDDKLNSFQLLLTNRGNGDFDATFNYGDILWETGDASDGFDGYGGVPAVVGYTAGTGEDGTSLELPGSMDSGALLDGGPDALISGTLDANGVAGRYVFAIRN